MISMSFILNMQINIIVHRISLVLYHYDLSIKWYNEKSEHVLNFSLKLLHYEYLLTLVCLFFVKLQPSQNHH